MTQPCSCHGSNGRLSETAVGVLERPLYAPGLILEDSDLTAAVDYTRDLNRLMFRSLFGCGVVCGMQVGVGGDCGLKVTVEPGLALDGCGDPLHLAGPATITLERRDGVLPGPDGQPTKRDFWIVACSRDKSCAPRSLVCDADDLDGTKAPTRARLGVEISVAFEPPHCVCGCRPFGDDPKKWEERAEQLLPVNPDGVASSNPCGNDPHDCHTDHYTDPKCRADCGCGSACSSGCCVLLAWVHWFGGKNGGWGVMHKGVRRFIRPCLIDDPIKDRRPVQEVETPEQPPSAPPAPEKPKRPQTQPPPPPPVIG